MFDVVIERLLSTRMDPIANICGGSAAPRLVVRIRHGVDPLCCGDRKDQCGAVHSGGVVVVLQDERLPLHVCPLSAHVLTPSVATGGLQQAAGGHFRGVHHPQRAHEDPQPTHDHQSSLPFLHGLGPIFHRLQPAHFALPDPLICQNNQLLPGRRLSGDHSLTLCLILCTVLYLESLMLQCSALSNLDRFNPANGNLIQSMRLNT